MHDISHICEVYQIFTISVTCTQNSINRPYATPRHFSNEADVYKVFSCCQLKILNVLVEMPLVINYPINFDTHLMMLNH